MDEKEAEARPLMGTIFLVSPVMRRLDDLHMFTGLSSGVR